MSARDDDECPSDEREQDLEDRRHRARLWHWCSECHGHTGPGSPCADDSPPPEDDPVTETEDQ